MEHVSKSNQSSAQRWLQQDSSQDDNSEIGFDFPAFENTFEDPTNLQWLQFEKQMQDEGSVSRESDKFSILSDLTFEVESENSEMDVDSGDVSVEKNLTTEPIQTTICSPPTVKNCPEKNNTYNSIPRFSKPFLPKPRQTKRVSLKNQSESKRAKSSKFQGYRGFFNDRDVYDIKYDLSRKFTTVEKVFEMLSPKEWTKEMNATRVVDSSAFGNRKKLPAQVEILRTLIWKSTNDFRHRIIDSLGHSFSWHKTM